MRRSGRVRGLAPGEQVVIEVRPHWWVLAPAAALLTAVVAGAIASVVMSPPRAVKWLVLVVLVFSIGWLVHRYIQWAFTSLVVTSRRVIERRGVVSRSTREIPIGSLADIGYRQSLFERLIGAGDVVLESAGSHGAEVFEDLPHPAEIHNEIYAQIDMWRRSPGSAGPSIPEQIEQLDRLRQRGVISRSEFEAKKAALLDRL